MTTRRSIADLFPPEVRERLAYQDYLQARADRTGMPIRRPYCGCVSSWKLEECHRDSGCTFPSTGPFAVTGPWPGHCQACGAVLNPPDATSCKACGEDDIDD